MGSELVGRGTTEVLQSNTAEDLLTQPTKTGLAGLSNAAEPRSLESTSLKSEAIIQRPFRVSALYHQEDTHTQQYKRRSTVFSSSVTRLFSTIFCPRQQTLLRARFRVINDVVGVY